MLITFFFLFVGAKLWMYAALQIFLFVVVVFSLNIMPLTGSPIIGVYKLHLGQVHKIAKE